MTEQTAQLNYLHVAPRKVRLIANTLRGLSVQEAEAQLMLRSQRSTRPLLKLLRSAVANAKQNQKLEPRNLIVARIMVDQGPILKRSLPRAMGRATPIHKKMSHITLVLAQSPKTLSDRFVIAPPVKEKKEGKKAKEAPKNPPAEKRKEIDQRATRKTGFFKRFFRRKAV